MISIRTSSNPGQEFNATPDNPFPGQEGTYYLGQYEIWVRSSDQVVIDGPRGVGLSLSEWMSIYGSNSTDYH